MMNYNRPVLTEFQHIAPLLIQKYERYLPTAFDESLSILEKMNKIIHHINAVGELSNGLIDKWNEVMEWVMNDGLTEAVIAKLDMMVADGTLDEIINHHIFADLNEKIDGVEASANQRIDDLQNHVDTYDTVTVHRIFVNGTSGNDSDDGSQEFPYKTIRKAIDQLLEMGDAAIDGRYEIRLSGTIREGVRIYELPRFRYPLKIMGEVDFDGSPKTVMEMDDPNDFIGLRFEYCSDLTVEVHNIHFRNYGTGFNGYAVLMKRLGNISIYNCIAENCDIGFAAIGNVYFHMEDCRAINCNSRGFVAQYSSSGDFNHCYANNTVHGFHITRNAVAHIDFCIAENNTYSGATVDMNSRVHILGTNFKRNNYGVRAEGGGEWINNLSDTNNFNEGTSDANTVNYGHFGNSRETRLYGQSATNEFRTGVILDEKVHTGSTENTAIYALGNIFTLPAHFFTDKNKKMRFKVFGVISGEGTKQMQIYATNTQGSAQYSLGDVSTDDPFGSFVYEMDVYARGENDQVVTQRFAVQDDQIRVTANAKVMPTDRVNMFRVYAQLSDASAEITFFGFEAHLMG